MGAISQGFWLTGSPTAGACEESTSISEERAKVRAIQVCRVYLVMQTVLAAGTFREAARPDGVMVTRAQRRRAE